MINLNSLENSGYILHSTRNVGPRAIRRYQLADSTSQDAVIRAAQAILALTRNNPDWCPIFDVDPQETLQQIVTERSYLVINGNAICLASESQAPRDVPATAWDRFFSETLLKEPIRCEKNHSLERSSAVYWRAKFGDVCPGGGAPHGMGAMEIDEELQEDVARYRDSQPTAILTKFAEQCKKSEELEERLRKQEVKTLMLQSSMRPTRTGELAGCSAKMAVKLPTIVLKSSIVVVKESAKIVLKKLPLVSFFVGLCLGVYRIWHGRQYKRALGEVTSGALAGFFPGIGTGISIGIDGILLGIDIHEVTLKDVSISPESAHTLLGLDPAVPQTRAEIRRSYFAICRKLHPDTLSGVDLEPVRNQCAELLKKVTEAKDILMQFYQFNEPCPPLEEAYALLELDPATDVTKEMIDGAHRTLLETIHQNSMIPAGVTLTQTQSAENGWRELLDNAKVTLMNYYQYA